MRDLRALGIGFEQEYKFHPTRRWRADFLISHTKILIEVEGGFGHRTAAIPEEPVTSVSWKNTT